MTSEAGVRPVLVAAVIDVGSNSVLLLTVAVTGGSARAVDAARATTRLGAGLASGGMLGADARQRTAATVDAFAAQARRARATRVWAFATGAARDAADGAAFVADLAAATGLPIELLSAEREARLAYAGATTTLDPFDGPQLVVDVGGRTTELTFGVGERIVATASLPLGALALTEAYGSGDPPSAAARARVAGVVDEALATSGLPDRARAAGARLVASGGTATALAAVDLGFATYDPERVHGRVLARERVAALCDRLVGLAPGARAALPGLDPGRAAILPAGAIVLGRIMAAVGAGAVVVSDQGVRHAYLRAALEAEGVPADFRRLWR